MEGCGWATERAAELLRLLGTRPAALKAALEGEAGVEERERASRQRGADADADRGASGEGVAKAATAKKGKKGRGGK